MLSNLDLNHLLTFPFKDDEARKQFLIGVLVYLTIFIIPILPLMVVTGYIVRIMRQVLNGEQPRMVAWDDWGGMLTDGARIIGARLVFMLPVFLLLCPLVGLNIALPIFIENVGQNGEWVAIAFPFLFVAFFFLFVPLLLMISFLLPAAEVHVAEQAEFAAAFRVREWWRIFRANWSGFLLAFAIAYAISFALTLIVQFAALTIVLICLLPFLVPAIGLYSTLLMYVLYAQAYQEGKERLKAGLIPTSP